MTQTKIISAKVQSLTLPIKKRLTTPQLLKTGLYVTWAVSLVLAIATILGVEKQRYAIKTLGKDAAPSIVLAERIKDTLAGMDAAAVNELLVKSKENQLAIKDYEERRKAFAERLIAAAQNITYGAELKPIQTLQLEIGDYIAKLQQARDFNARGETQGVLSAYREAAQIMDNTLLPAADALAEANSQELDITYDHQKDTTAKALFLVVISGLPLLSVLVVIQLFLNYRMRRVFNPMLATATVITVIFVGYTIHSFISSSSNLKSAKEDSFGSLHALRRIRALAYGLKADESRYLLDPAFAAKHEQAFLEKVTKIARIPSSETFETVANTLAQGKKVDGFQGLLADEFKNIASGGEREMAVSTLVALGRYLTVDKQIRQLEQSGEHQQAIALCIGYEQAQSNGAFTEFKKAHQKTSDTNQQAFDKAVARGFSNVNGFEITTPVVAVVICVLTLLGLLPRIKEYY